MLHQDIYKLWKPTSLILYTIFLVYPIEAVQKGVHIWSPSISQTIQKLFCSENQGIHLTHIESLKRKIIQLSVRGIGAVECTLYLPDHNLS